MIKPNKWQQLNIKDITEFIRNGLNVKQSDEKKGYPITRIETISKGVIDINKVKYAEINVKDFQKYKMDYGDILFSHINSTEHIAKTAIYEGTPEILIHGVNLLLLKPKKEIIYPKYLNYYLKTHNMRKYFSVRCKKAVNQSSLNQQDIRGVKIPVPLIPTQRKIASILEKTESAREKRREANRLTNEFLKSAFIEIFGDPALNTKKLPLVKCGDISSHVSSGLTPLGGQKTYLKSGILFIRSQNVHVNKLDLSDVAYLSDAVHNKMKRTWVKNGDVLLNITGASIGRVAYFIGKDNSANVNQHVCIIRPKKKKIVPEYLSFLISMPNYQKKIFAQNAGATRQAFNFEQIKKFEIPIAPIELQQKFAELVHKVEKLKAKQRESEKELDNLFNSLMQRAFRGEVV
jgi:type I restriction enzyme S subunit